MPPKNETLRLLVLHESQDNAEQIVNALKNSGTATRPTLAADEEELVDALQTGSWDIMLAGEQTDDVPYDTALALIRKQEKDLPLIVLLNEHDPELIEEALRGGAVDALPASDHGRLVLVIKRELRNLQARRAQRRLEAALAEAEMRNRLLLDNSKDAIAYVHDGMHIYANGAYVELFGHDSTEELEGMPVIDLVAKEDLDAFKNYLKAYSKGESVSDDLRFHGLKGDGSKINAMMQLSAASYDGEPCTQIVIRLDTGVDETVLAEKLKEATTQDSLTGLTNRQGFEETLAAAIRAARSEKKRFALLYMGIDNISTINSSYGLSGADAVIADIAQALARRTDSGRLARFSDNAFTALVADVDTDAAQKLANQICHAVHDHLIEVPGGRTVQTSLTIGLVMIGETAAEPAEMISRALTAADTYRSKNAKGNGVSVYNPAEKASESSSALLELLVQALEKNQFKLLFQPLIDVRGEGGEFYEVFLRLPLTDGKEMLPEEFIPVAIQHQLGAKIDRWVLINAAKLLKEHVKASPNTRMMVNLTSESLTDPSLPVWAGKLSKAISAGGQHLVLQFHENDVVDYLKHAKEQAIALHAQGCQVAVSRFGCQINRFNSLSHVSVDFVKLDGSFTQDLNSEDNLNEIRKIVGELTGRDLRIVVPFVESAAALSKLWTLGVDYLQGYYLQAPTERMHYENQ